MKHALRKLIVATLVAFFVAPVSAQMSVFNKSGNLMTLQLVKAGQFYFSKMLLTLPVPPVLWRLDDKGVPVNPLNAADAALYNKTAGTLTIPVLKIDSTVYSNVKLFLPDPDNNPSGASWSLVDLGNVMSTSSPGYDFSYPIVGTMPNKYCTDSAGELSYVIDVPGSTRPQVWKHVADDPCCPLSVTTNSPANIAGTSDVQIYPNPGEGPSTGNFRMMVTYTGKVSSANTVTNTCAKNVTNSVYAGNCVLTAAGTCVADTDTPASTVCVKNVTDSVYAGACVLTAANTCVPTTAESCVVNVPPSIYAGGCFSAGPGLCNPTTGATDYWSCVKNVPDSVYSGACFSPEIGICNATTGAADNGYCTGSLVKRSQFCSLIDNTKYCTKVTTPATSNNQYCSLVTSTTPGLVDQTGVETCVVRPVIDVSNYPAGSNRAALAVSQNTVNATIGQRSTVYISGGLPPYFVTASVPGVVYYELLAADSTGIGQPLVIDGKAIGATQLTVFDYNGTALPIAVKSASLPLFVSPASIDVPEGTLVDVRIEGGVPPLTVYNPTPAWVDAPATVATTPTTITIAMKKSSGSSKTFLVFTDAAGTQASIGEIKISASTGNSTVLPSTLTLKVGESSLIYVTGGTPPMTITNTRPDLIDIPPSLTTIPGTVSVYARKSSSGQAIPIYFVDKYGLQNTVNVTVTSPSTILQ